MSQTCIDWTTPARACTEKAERASEFKSEEARAAVLAYLRQNPGGHSGEVLTNHCVSIGIVPHDGRAFGSVLAGLSRAGLIRKVGFCARQKGHGTAGGVLWALAEEKS